MLHILISGHHSNNRVTESDDKLNEMTYLLNKFWCIICPFYDFDRENGQIIAFAILRDWVRQENAMVDFFIVLLKIIHVPVSCVHRFYIQNHAPSALFCETENLVRFHG